MISRYSQQGCQWIDVLKPTQEEVRSLFKEFKLPIALSNDLTTTIPKSNAFDEKGVVKMTLDFPIVKRTDIRHPHEIKFIATKDCLITVRFEDIHSIDRFAKEFEVASILKKDKKKKTGADFLLIMLNYLYTGLEEKLDYLEAKIQEIEEDIFEQGDKSTLINISYISRRLTSFSHTVSPHPRVLRELQSSLGSVFGKAYFDSTAKFLLSLEHIGSRSQTLTNTLNELRTTNNSLLTSRQNEIMKIFTILAFVTFPLSLLTSLFGMNTTNTPLVSSEHGFWYIVIIMSIISVLFFAYFRYKKWI